MIKPSYIMFPTKIKTLFPTKKHLNTSIITSQDKQSKYDYQSVLSELLQKIQNFALSVAIFGGRLNIKMSYL